MKRFLRRVMWKILGPPPSRAAWRVPVDTRRARSEAVDMALWNLNICTRGERESAATAPPVDTLVGDYAEFGVFRGDTFKHVAQRSAQLAPWMRLFAFDSFAGLPAPVGEDRGGEFVAGQFACSQSDFTANLARAGVDLARVTMVPGWFHE